QAAYDAQQAALKPIAMALVATRKIADDLRSLRTQVKDLQSRVSKDDYSDWSTQAEELIKSIDTLEVKLIQPKQKTFQDVINFPNQLDAELAHIYGTIANQEPPVTDGQKAYAADMLKKYETLMKETESVMKSAEALQQATIDQKIPFLAPKKKN
ncbi:MAG: Mg2+ and Co2+ transporter CorA, partial [Algoriphagus sp.]